MITEGERRYRGQQGMFVLDMQRREKQSTELRLPWYCKARYKIAYAVDYIGQNNDITTISFRGAEMKMLYRVFRYLYGDTETRSHLCSSIQLITEPDCIIRNGYTNRRVSVVLNDYNTDLIDLDTFLTIMEGVILRECNCSITRLTLGKFLNT